jgi:isopentenyl-diphosphate delta-isomerase
VFICDSQGRLLMQQRAVGKYHSPLLWSNTCCGHPRPGEEPSDAGRRRLGEEMGVSCALYPTTALTYRLEVGDGLFEHELNHIFVGTFDGDPQPSLNEVAAWAWVDSTALRALRRGRARSLTPWFEPVVTALSDWACAENGLPPALRTAIARWR